MVHLLSAYYPTTAHVDILNATSDVKRALRESQIINGILTVLIPGNTACVILLENDRSIHEAFRELLLSFVMPSDEDARPSRKSGTGKLSSHLLAGLIPKSLSIPIKDGKLIMGAWQEVVVYDFDDKIGRREVLIHVDGEKPEKK